MMRCRFGLLSRRCFFPGSADPVSIVDERSSVVAGQDQRELQIGRCGSRANLFKSLEAARKSPLLSFGFELYKSVAQSRASSATLSQRNFRHSVPSTAKNC